MAISRVSEPSHDGPKVPFLRRVAKPGEFYEAVILASEVFWVYTHFDLKKYRTYVCTADRESTGEVIRAEDCEGCASESVSRIRGYLHCWGIKSRREEFLEITPDTWKFCKLAWPAVPSLRGWRVSANRGKGSTSPLTIHLAEPLPSQDMGKMPKAKTPEDCLRNAMKK